MSQSTIYDTDILEWSEQQASALRELARVRPDLSNVIDWENVAEEIEDVGRSQFLAIQSFVRLILIHVIKAWSVPDAPAMLHWRTEVSGFHRQFLDRITASMQARLDLAQLWQQAIKQARLDLAVHGQAVAPSLPRQCPLRIEDMIDPEFDLFSAVERLRSSTTRQQAK